MYDQIREDFFFILLYGGVASMALVASFYLLLRRANAIAPEITPPARLRRWTGIFFASIALCHLWYIPTYFLTSSDDRMLSYLIAVLLDCITVIPLAIIVLLAMLQDRRRPLWPPFAMVAPLAIGMACRVASRSEDLLPVLFVYFLLMCIGLIIYMVCAIRQYGRWLRDNYSDLEHKEVWQGFVVLGIILLVFFVYSLDLGELKYDYAMEMTVVLLVGYLLWRVETLSDLSISVNNAAEEMVRNRPASSFSLSKNIEPLLKEFCEERQLYLQYDMSIMQLAQQIGINRSYLSKHFALQGVSYNAYINGLRIQHFVNLYHESVATHQPITAQQLAHQSGFHSYSTFSAAFKQSMGMTATEWMRNNSEQKQQ